LKHLGADVGRHDVERPRDVAEVASRRPTQ
jgi:hypothetical protein